MNPTFPSRISAEVRLYVRLLRMHLLSGMEYKGWWLMLLQVFLVVVSDPLAVVLLFSRFGSIGEWTVERILLVYALSVASCGIAECLCRGFDYFPWQLLRSGDFDRLLLRPASLFTQVAASAFHLHRLSRPITALAAVLWALDRMDVALSLRTVSVLGLALAGGSLMYAGVFVFTSGLAFFTIKGLDWIYLLTNASYQITRVPEPFIPGLLKKAFRFLLPVLVISFYPATTACGWNYPQAAGWLALPAGAAFLAFSILIWRVGVRHYKSTGS